MGICVPHEEGGIGGWKRKKMKKWRAVGSNLDLLLGIPAAPHHRPWDIKMGTLLESLQPQLPDLLLTVTAFPFLVGFPQFRGGREREGAGQNLGCFPGCVTLTCT